MGFRKGIKKVAAKKVAQPVQASQPAMNIGSGRVKNATDVRYEPLYDTVYLPASGITAFSYRLFSTPIGGTTDERTTNMTLAGILPTPQAMTIMGIRAEAIVYTAADYELLAKLIRGSYIRFFVGTKDYLEVPLSYVCGKQTSQLFGSKNDGTAKRFQIWLGEGSENGCKFADNKVIQVAPNENFGMDWVGSISHTPGVITPVRFYLEGIRYVEVR